MTLLKFQNFILIFLVKEYRDLPEPDLNDPETSFSSKSSKSRLVLSTEEQAGYDSTNRNQLFSGQSSNSWSSNRTTPVKNVKGIFDDV